MEEHAVAVEVEVIAADFFEQYVERQVPAIESEVTIQEYGEPEISHTSSPSFDANEAENAPDFYMDNSYSPSEGSAAEPEPEYSEDELSENRSSATGDSPPKRKRQKKHHQKSATSGKKKKKKEKKEKRKKLKTSHDHSEESSASSTYEEIKAAVLSVTEVLEGEPFHLDAECRQGLVNVLNKSTCQNNPCVICGAKCFTSSNMSKHVWGHLGGILGKEFVHCLRCEIFPGATHVDDLKNHLWRAHKIAKLDEQLNCIDDRRLDFARPYLTCWRRCFPAIQEAALGSDSILELINPGQWRYAHRPKGKRSGGGHKVSRAKRWAAEKEQSSLAEEIIETGSNHSGATSSRRTSDGPSPMPPLISEQVQMLQAEMQELRQLDASFDRQILYEGDYDSFHDEMPEEAKTCQLCGFVSRGRGRMGYADHAWKHVTDLDKGTAIFRCRLCSAGQATYTGALSHLRQIHEIGKDGADGCVEDHRLEFAVAYAHCWRRCYPLLQEIALEKFSILQLVDEGNVPTKRNDRKRGKRWSQPPKPQLVELPLQSSIPLVAGPVSAQANANHLKNFRIYVAKPVRLPNQNPPDLASSSEENPGEEFGQQLVDDGPAPAGNATEGTAAASGLADAEDDFEPIFPSSNELESAVALASVATEDSFNPSIECRVGEISQLTAAAYKKLRCAECGLETGDNDSISSHVWNHLAALLNDQAFLVCAPCGQGFGSVELVMRHIQRVHGIVGDDAQIPLIEDGRSRFVRQYIACFRRCYPNLQEVALGPCSILGYFDPVWAQENSLKSVSPAKSGAPKPQRKRIVAPRRVINLTAQNLSRLESLKQDVINAASGCYPINNAAIYEGLIDRFPMNLSEMPANACMCAVCDEVPKLGQGRIALGEHAWRHVQEAIGSAIYRCKKCKLGFPVRCSMVQHLRIGHQIDEENVDDFMEDHRREFAIPYLVSWRRCFPQIQEAALEMHSIGELIGRPPRPKRSDLPEAFQRVIQQQKSQPYRTRTARNLLELELKNAAAAIKQKALDAEPSQTQFGFVADSLVCQLCQEHLSGGLRRYTVHVWQHVGRLCNAAILQCASCDFTEFDVDLIRLHWMQSHANSSGSPQAKRGRKVIDHRNSYVTEFLQCATQCFPTMEKETSIKYLEQVEGLNFSATKAETGSPAFEQFAIVDDHAGSTSGMRCACAKCPNVQFFPPLRAMMEQHIWCTHVPPELDRSAPMFLCYFCPAAAHDFQLMQHHCIDQHGNPNGFLNLCLERAAAFSAAWTECFPGASFVEAASQCNVEGASSGHVQVEPRTAQCRLCCEELQEVVEVCLERRGDHVRFHIAQQEAICAPFKCLVCQKVFMDRLLLMTHLMVDHKNNRPRFGKDFIDLFESTWNRCFGATENGRLPMNREELKEKQAEKRKSGEIEVEKAPKEDTATALPKPRKVLRCEKCGLQVSPYKREEHVYHHLIRAGNVSMQGWKGCFYRCRHCDWSTMINIELFAVNHCRVQHRIGDPRPSVDFESLLNPQAKNRKDFADMNLECFGQPGDQHQQGRSADEAEQELENLMEEFEEIVKDEAATQKPKTPTKSKQKCELCSLEKQRDHFVVRAALVDHIWSHVATDFHAALYQCVICGCGFESTDVCQQHVTNYHQISVEIAPQKVLDCRRKRMADFYQMSMACFPQLQLHHPDWDSTEGTTSAADHEYHGDEAEDVTAANADDIDHLITDEIDWVDKLMTGEIEPQSPAKKKPRLQGIDEKIDSPPRIEPDTSYFCKKCTDELQRPVEVVGRIRDEHVWGHLGTMLDDSMMFFACRFCDGFQCRTEDDLLAHMNQLHKNRKPKLGVDYDSLRSQFKEEFETVERQCFGVQHQAGVACERCSKFIPDLQRGAVDHVWLHVKSDAQIASFYRCSICQKPMKSVIDARMHAHNEHDVPYAKAAKSIENLQDEMGEQFLGEFRVCFPQLAERLQFVGPGEVGGESSFSIGAGSSGEASQSTQSELRVMRFTL